MVLIELWLRIMVSLGSLREDNRSYKMATQNWPADVPESPLLDGYTRQRQNSKLRTSVDAGLDKVRNRYRATPINITERYHFTNTEKQDFVTFHDDSCDGGAERFIKKNPETGIDSEYRFTAEPQYEVVGYGSDGAIWNVSLAIEIMPT